MATDYPLTPGTLNSNCYPADPQSLYNEMFAKGLVTLSIEGVVVDSSTPGITDRGKLWVKLDGSGFPVGRFIWRGGLWVWPHEVPASSAERRIWTGSTASLVTYDGGLAGTVSDAAGPFWEEDTDFAARMPLGVGTLPDSGTAVAIGDTGGSDEHELTVSELPEFTPSALYSLDSGEIGGFGAGGVGGIVGDNEESGTTSYPFTTIGGGQGHQNMPPYRGVFFIKRTARIYRTG